MPSIVSTDDDGKICPRYGWPAQYVTPTREISDALRGWRKEAIRGREEFMFLQKNVQDREAAKFLKECANREMKRQRACTLMIPWFGEPDRNQTPERPIMWPLELVHELDEIANRIVMDFG